MKDDYISEKQLSEAETICLAFIWIRRVLQSTAALLNRWAAKCSEITQ